MSYSFFWDVTQRRSVVSYRGFGIAYRLRLQRSSSFLELLSHYVHTKSVRAFRCFPGITVFGAVCSDVLEIFLNPILEVVVPNGTLFQ